MNGAGELLARRRVPSGAGMPPGARLRPGASGAWARVCAGSRGNRDSVLLGDLLDDAAARRETLRAAIRRRRRGDWSRLELARDAVNSLPWLDAARRLLRVVEREREAAPAVVRHSTAALLAA